MFFWTILIPYLEKSCVNSRSAVISFDIHHFREIVNGFQTVWIARVCVSVCVVIRRTAAGSDDRVEVIRRTDGPHTHQRLWVHPDPLPWIPDNDPEPWLHTVTTRLKTSNELWSVWSYNTPVLMPSRCQHVFPPPPPPHQRQLGPLLFHTFTTPAPCCVKHTLRWLLVNHSLSC